MERSHSGLVRGPGKLVGVKASGVRIPPSPPRLTLKYIMMVMERYKTIEELIGMIDEPNQTGCKRLLEDNRQLFQKVQGSTNNHQNWLGGYIDHITEVMNIANVTYPVWNNLRPLPFSKSDALLTVYLHDVEKPWKYELRDDGQLYHRAGMDTKEQHQAYRMKVLEQYGIMLTPEHINGLKYAEGELNDYSNRERKMGPLAAFTHMCDVTSARLWFAHPQETDDPWKGARRFRI